MPEAGQILQGRTVGNFRLSRYLGGTERSAVFLAERLRGAPKAAAIKIIPADPARADLQLSRWNLISRLSHPHLLRIFEAGRCRQDGEELLYVVMEYAEENLAQILPQRPLTSDETNEMFKPTLDALAYLHGRGFVHGHLKPSNILVVGDQLKLSSDGICRVGEVDDTGIGTYGPPDFSGTAATPSRDIWSLGVTLVQVLTQLFPVRGGNQQKGVTLPETLPSQFIELAQNCLEPDPQRRCTLEEIAEHLHYKLPARTLGPPSLPAEPTVDQRPEPARRVTSAKPAKRSRWTLAAAAIVLTLIAIIGGARFFNRQPSQQETSTVAETPGSAQDASDAATRPPARAKTSSPAASLRTKPSSQRATLQRASEVRSVPRPGVSPGDLVPGEVVRQQLPDAPQSALNTIHGTVRVTLRVRVDPKGDIAGVSFISAGPSRYFARLALNAAQQWKFSSARRDGRAVASAWTVRFEFTRGGVRAVPVAVP
jgi:TonB family protein